MSHPLAYRLRYDTKLDSNVSLVSLVRETDQMNTRKNVYQKAPFFRSLGYGSIVVARKRPSESP